MFFNHQFIMYFAGAKAKLMILSEKLKNKVLKIQDLYQKGEFNDACDIVSELSSDNPENFYLQNLYGVISISLNNWEIAKKCFLKTIEIESHFPEAYNNLGLTEISLGNLEEALKNFLKALDLRPNYDRPHNNILKILTYFKPKKFKNNRYIIANNLINKIKYNYNQNEYINDLEVKDFFNKCNQIVNKNLLIQDTIETQIYRQNSVDLNCKRHFKVFNEFNAIPKFCFGCFKITLETKNVLELFKLYFIFDQLKLDNNNTRKCMIELRENISGGYKGFIYCSSVSEGEKIKYKLKKILDKNLKSDLSLNLKRGCSEFSLSYPEYKKASIKSDEMMEYDKNWEKKEKIIDNKIWNKNSSESKNFETLKGCNLSDILIMRKWLNYAKNKGDNSYKFICENL